MIQSALFVWKGYRNTTFRLESSTQKDLTAQTLHHRTMLIIHLTMNVREYQVQTQASCGHGSVVFNFRTLLNVTAGDIKSEFYFQFMTYDENDLIADIGGYLGLLMGQSLLALYDLSHEYLVKLYSWYQIIGKSGICNQTS